MESIEKMLAKYLCECTDERICYNCHNNQSKQWKVFFGNQITNIDKEQEQMTQLEIYINLK